jgi:predicted glycoside hydrolase/deacetylase ChbG (UPF0249 family)
MTGTSLARQEPSPREHSFSGGLLVVNADDWGIDRETTETILCCVLRGAVSSVSAMVFMEDSERAATVAREGGVDAGLHLNFTTRFSARGCAPRLAGHQQAVARFLRRHRFAPVIFHPGLQRSFEYVTSAQVDEFRRLYGADPYRIDGHHHMHLCANVLIQKLLPRGTLVRRNFSFRPGEKGLWNRAYRALVDGALERRHSVVDFLFPLAPFRSERLQRICALARHAVVEVETHPVQPEEYRYLTGGEMFQRFDGVAMGSHALVARSRRARRGDA